MDIGCLQDDGVIFLWVTGTRRALACIQLYVYVAHIRWARTMPSHCQGAACFLVGHAMDTHTRTTCCFVANASMQVVSWTLVETACITVI